MLKSASRMTDAFFARPVERKGAGRKRLRAVFSPISFRNGWQQAPGIRSFRSFFLFPSFLAHICQTFTTVSSRIDEKQNYSEKVSPAAGNVCAVTFQLIQKNGAKKILIAGVFIPSQSFKTLYLFSRLWFFITPDPIRNNSLLRVIPFK